ncbi:MAG: protein kinase [Gemmatimonas sp.]
MTTPPHAPERSSPMLARVTAALAPAYTVQRELGAGGMATVYLAHDARHERDVAIKVLHPDLGAALGADRFLAEIKTTAKLQHPHILPLLDSGSADGLLWYAMPYVEGETLRGRLQRETQLPIAEAVRLAREVADALQAAHARGVVHRDIKPENILLQGGPGTPHALVADFGIALAVQSAGGARMTQTGLSLGTPQYMSPEQATGEKVIDARSDLYALGAVTYEMLAGEPPFTGPSTQAIVARLLSAAPPSLTATRSTIPPHVEAAVLTALAKLPADRQASVSEFAAQLTGAMPVALTHAGEAHRQTGTAVEGSLRDPRRITRTLNRTRAMLGVTTLIALAATGVVTWLVTRPTTVSPVSSFLLSVPDSASLLDAPVSRRVAISRDGRRVYFVGGTTANFGLFRRDLADTLVQRVPGTDRGYGPVLCPDGKWIYFGRAPQEVWRVSPEGGQATRVLDSATVGDCNDAGEVLVLRRGRLLLWRDGQAPREIAGADSARGEGSLGTGSFLPGGTHAVFSLRRIGQMNTSSTLATVPLAGGATTPLTVTGLRPTWSNGQLLFVRDGDLVAAPFDAQRNLLLGEGVSVVRNVATRNQGVDFDVSDDGTLVYASGTFGTRYRLARVDRGGREELLDREPALYSWPRVSPDGKRIAVEVQSSNSTFDVWLFALASRSLERLTSGFSGVRPLGWSADGRRIAYLTMEQPGTPQAKRIITWVPWDLSSPPQRIPVRTPDGSQVEDATLRSSTDLLVFRSRGYGAPGDLWVAGPPPAGDTVRQARPFVVTDADEETPRLSPDGRWVAYASNETGQFEVYARAADGTGGRVSLSAGYGAEPVWTPDGRGLYFRGEGRMHFVALTSGTTLEVMRHDTLFVDPYRRESLAIPYDVFPDGQSLLMQKPGGTSSRYPIVVLNWMGLLRQGGAKR